MAKEKMNKKQEPVKNNKRIKSTKEKPSKGKIVGKNTKAKEKQLPKREVTKTQKVEPKVTTPKEPKVPSSPIKVDPCCAKEPTSKVRKSYLVKVLWMDKDGNHQSTYSVFTSLVRAEESIPVIIEKFRTSDLHLIEVTLTKCIADSIEHIDQLLSGQEVKLDTTIEYSILNKPKQEEPIVEENVDTKEDVKEDTKTEKDTQDGINHDELFALVVKYEDTIDYKKYRLCKLVGLFENHLEMKKAQSLLDLELKDKKVETFTMKVKKLDGKDIDQLTEHYRTKILKDVSTQVGYRRVRKGLLGWFCKLFNCQ